MARDQSTRLRETLKATFSDRMIRSLAEESGFIVRARKVNPVAFFWTLVLGFGGGSHRTIAGLRRQYVRTTGTDLVPSAFYDRFTAGLVSFLKAAVERLLQDFRARVTEVGERYSMFKDLLVADATVIKLHDALAKVFPGTRSHYSPAAAKLHVVMSVKGAGKSTVRISSERVHDRKKLRVGPWAKGRLFVFDLGYYSFQLFSCIVRNGGYFLTRLKENANPVITAVHRGSEAGIVGCNLQDVLVRLKRALVDLEVELRFRKRSYRGRRSAARKRYRLVAIRDTNKPNTYHTYLTNLSSDLFSAEEVANTYRARWEIELLFKELKSGYRLDHLDSKRPEVVKALIYSAILTLLVSRRLLQVVARGIHQGRERVTTGRWWRLLQTYAQELLLLVLRPPRELGALRGLYKTMIHELVDPHTNRRPLLAQVLQ